MIKILNVVGLCLDIAGALVMFYNTPHPTQEPMPKTVSSFLSAGWLLWGKDQEKLEKKRVKIGMSLLIVGFVLQLIAVIIGQ